MTASTDFAFTFLVETANCDTSAKLPFYPPPLKLARGLSNTDLKQAAHESHTRIAIYRAQQFFFSSPSFLNAET